MPGLDTIGNDCNLILFTTRRHLGRFGFLIEMTDDDLKDQESSDDN